jgi:hypothetical protein
MLNLPMALALVENLNVHRVFPSTRVDSMCSARVPLPAIPPSTLTG